jgi:hypothetical protein
MQVNPPCEIVGDTLPTDDPPPAAFWHDDRHQHFLAKDENRSVVTGKASMSRYIPLIAHLSIALIHLLEVCFTEDMEVRYFFVFLACRLKSHLNISISLLRLSTKHIQRSTSNEDGYGNKFFECDRQHSMRHLAGITKKPFHLYS